MRVCCEALRKSLIVAGCLLVALQPSLAQKKPAVSTAEATRGVLMEKARALESRGRPDMAVQLWQQVLLSDPNNTEALAGVAKDYKLMGSAEKANAALDRLREASPNDPNIARIEALSSTGGESEQLREAGELAKQGKADDAMRIYKELYGDHPPDGDIAMAYYQTLYGTATGKATAIAGMRALADRNPADSRYAIGLGTMLTYDPRTRADGIRILKAHGGDSDAQTALRQALIWDAANPSSAAELREYLKTHPQDTEVEKNLKEDELKLAQMNGGIARTPAERAAFAALNAHRMDEAEKRFTDLLQQEPNNGRVAAGMGFLRMQARNFSAAISYLTQAEQDGFKDRTVEDALTTSRFWYTMGEASQAFEANQLGEAAAKYKAALAIKPRSPEALNGLAGLLTKEQQYLASAEVYEQLIKVQPSNSDGWRGLFLAYARDDQNQKAIAVSARFPAKVKAELGKDPEYLRTLATIYQAQGRNADAERVLAQALSLPFPDNGTSLKADTKLQYAGILMEAKRFDQAVTLYGQIIGDDPSNLSAWMGLISAHHELGQDAQAIDDVKKMPAATYESALADAGFLSMLGAMYQQANQFEVAQGMLERSEKIQISGGGQPSVALQLQLAGIYLLRNNTDQAYALYSQVLKKYPDRADAWKGLIATLLVTNRNSEALQEISLIPAAPRKQLENDIEFVQSEASLYAARGDLRHAAEYMSRVQAHYAKLKMEPPANIAVQNAWLLYNTGSDRALYPALMRLGGRSDLTVAQRETVQDIWANWSVRRAGSAMDNGDVRRAVEILDAACLAFPDNLTVRKAVAGGYARVGRAKESVALFKTVPMQDATSGDFQGAIGAALAADDKTQAELWLRQALDRFPRDPAILSLAARYEQARGDIQRAADYWRASLAVMPVASPVDKLAHELVYPEEDLKPHRAVTAADLHRLLDPDYEPFAKTTKLPSAPAYGVDPYEGAAPVTPAHPEPASPQAPGPAENSAPSGSGDQSSAAPDSNPAVKEIPTTQPSSPQLFRRQSATEIELGTLSSNEAGPDGLVLRDAVYHPQDLGNMRLAQVQAARPAHGGEVTISANAPHSLASDAWKGLIFSLMSGNRNAEALQELDKVPADVRQQLEADIEFVQGIASLYVAVGDTRRAAEYLNRVEDYYLVHRTAAPAGLEVQHAWLLYNTLDDVALYPVLLRLDARQDMTAAQKEQVENLWANWAVRRAETAMESGHMLRGVEILQAAAQYYPDNMNIRRAVAGGYARVGRATDALALFKTIPMENATSGDYQGAISAALAATDMAQAEAWLRVALARFQGDPLILELSARFEQARGNNERAADFYRAALAAMPPGAAVRSLDSGLTYPPGSYHAPAPGDTKRLLDPRNEPLPSRVAPLPGDSSSSSNQAPVTTYLPPAPATPQNQWLNTPSTNPLPLPSATGANPDTVPSAQGTGPGSSPIHYIPPSTRQGNLSSQPIFINQSATQEATIRPAIARTQGGEQAQAASPSGAENPQQTQSLRANGSNPGPKLRITSQPMGSMAAQVQALFAEQTDSQLTQGSASILHALPNAPVKAVGKPDTGQYTVAQYTPSAQEAATGAYSVPKQQTAEPEKPLASAPVASIPTKRRRRSKHASQPTTDSTLGNTPALTGTSTPPAAGQAESQQQVAVPYDSQAQSTAPASTGAGLSDDELEQRNLPPLRGPWVRVQREPNPVNPRDEAEMQLRSIESGYSGWLGGTGMVSYRSGALGFDHLAALEAPFEASMPLGYHARFTIVAKPVFLDSGQADGNSTISVVLSTTAGNSLTIIPQPIGTLPNTNTKLPAQQNAVGLGGEIQLAFPHLSIAGGYTPDGFLVATVTGRAIWRPGNGPITISLVRDSEKDSQLSYAGLRDPAGNTLGNLGQIWGGVVYNQGNVQYARGNAESGFYFGAGGQYLTGYTVEKNYRIDGNGGAYWRLLTSPEYGNLSIGANFFAMHYEDNQDAFTHGMGGYFSPQGYFLGNVPFTFAGHYGTNWHYNIVGGIGVQAFQENKTPLWPLAEDKSLETGQNNPMLPDMTTVGANYDLRGQVAYQISPHWFAGGFFGANNTRNYSQVSAGFYVRYMFRTQPSTAAGPTGLFPSDGLRPFTVP